MAAHRQACPGPELTDSYIVCMTELRFEWDPKKALSNKRKHGVSFEEAETVSQTTLRS